MDFVDCHEEKIHISGHIQDFGYLIGLDAKSKTIKFFSQNISELFSIDKDFFGKRFANYPEIFSVILNSEILKNIEDHTAKEGDVVIDKVDFAGQLFHYTIYRSNEIIFLEFEKILDNIFERNYASKKYENIHQAADSANIWTELLGAVSEAVDYDRLMVYRFLGDGCGQVIAEKNKPGVESFMNLHYPESDIPSQARALYLKKRKRIFSDVYSMPVPIISSTEEAIDLTYSSIRAMAPVHGQYLKNMGVASTFSTSIIVDNKLWGLVTCQNIEQKHVDLVNRIRAEVFTVIAANAYTSCKSRQKLEDSIELDKRNVLLKTKLLAFDELDTSLFNNIEEIKAYPQADGLAIIVNNKIKTAGTVPTLDNIEKIANWAREQRLENFYASHEFNTVHREKLGFIDKAAGIIFGFTDENRTELLIWFRKEVDDHILWAGNPEKIKEPQLHNGELQLMVSPRKSFEIFIETIRGKSKPWKTKNILAAQKIVAIILETTYSQFKKVRELNEELKNLNEELDSFSYTISHDLGTPLTVMKLNAQMLEKSQTDNPSVQKKIKSILQEIEGMEMMMRGVLNLSRAKSSEISMEDSNTEKIISKICYDTKLTLNSDNTQIIVNSCPNVLADKVMLMQVFLNVIGNAVKYSSHSETPKVEIDGEIVNDKVIYRIKDNGIGIAEADQHNMFKIFHRMDNAKSFHGNGVGLSIVHRIMERLGGGITFESKENEGTTFILTFKKP